MDGASSRNDSFTIVIDCNKMPTFQRMPEAKISVPPSVSATYVLPSSHDADNDLMNAALSTSTTLPSYISFDPTIRTFSISAPNSANLNEVVPLHFELSDGYNKTSFTTNLFFSSIPTPTIISPIPTNIWVKVGETIIVPITLSSDFDDATDTLIA